MKKAELIAAAEKINWWHTIYLPYDEGGTYPTKGRVGLDHCDKNVLTVRFGIPESLKDKTVVDVGAFDGLMTFEAIQRGAKSVIPIDIYQAEGENSDGFELAAKAFGYDIAVRKITLEEAANQGVCGDIVFYYGVLYHVDSPTIELAYLSEVTKEYAIIETEYISLEIPVWEFRPNHVGDSTNKWYPSPAALERALLYVGFSRVEFIYSDGYRLTAKAYK
jgi:tRNA (mo5U34)-methyltransferase